MKWEKSGSIEEITREEDLLIVYGTNSLVLNFHLAEILTPEELKYSEQLRGPGQKDTWLSCRASLRLIMASFMSIDPKTIEFQIGKFGKLHIKNCHLFFNVSHSNNSFLLGFNHFGRIGVDIEKLSGREELPSLINYAFSEEEADYCSKGNLPARFTEVWTLKEAFLKAVGAGLVDVLPAITVKGLNDNYINRLILNQKSFLCPNGETGSIVYKKKQSIKSIWLT